MRRFLGTHTWLKLGEVRQEFKIRKQIVHMDPELFKIMDALLPKEGYYVDIGAHDGRSYSNTYHLEKFGWRGVLVEPILPTFFKLRQLRSLQSNDFVNAACVSFDYTSRNLLMSYGDLMSFAPEISYLDTKDWQNGSKQFLNRNEIVTETWVPAKTLNQILMDLKSPKNIDFISIDVEGAELEVLRGIDFSTYSFQLLCIETYNQKSILDFMSAKGYNAINYVAQNLIFQKIAN